MVPSAHHGQATVARAPDVRIVATALMGLAAIAVWWPTLGSWALWGLPAIAVATAMVAGIIRAQGPSIVGRAALTIALIAWPILVSLLAFGTLSTYQGGGLGDGVRALVLEARVRTQEPAALIVWVYLTSVAWTVGADLATRGGRRSAAGAFFALAAPLGLALGLQGQAGGAAWHGAIVLIAALLWATRGNLRGTVPFVAGVALVGVVVAAAIGPRSRWDALDHTRTGSGSSASGLTPRSTGNGSALNTDQTYGPLSDDLTGAEMLEVRSPVPALWRMQTLDVFDGRAWVAGTGRGDELPQPGAATELTQVKIAGLRDERAASLGRVASVSGAGDTSRAAGEAVDLSSPPGSGSTYSVTSALIAPTLAQLEHIRIPTGPAYTPYTAVFPDRSDIPTPATSIVPRMTPQFASSGWGRVFRMAYDLSQAPSELAVVRNVQNYLTTSGTFTYTFDAPPAGADPLVDFLTVSHRGYCQHFAGAAALLLRLAGVPARVAVGFATGVDQGNGTYKVRDEDAHAWIEVYFPGYGWAPFNPTPAGANALVAPGVDVLAPDGSGNAGVRAARGQSTSATAKYLALGVLVLVGAAFAAAWRRRRRALAIPALGDVLARLVPQPVSSATTHLQIGRALADLGPATAALAQQAERQRFAGSHLPPDPHPWRRVWRATIKDVGLVRAIRLMTVGPPRAQLRRGSEPGLKHAGDADSSTTGAPRSLVAAADVAASPTSSVAPPGSGAQPLRGG